MTELAMALRMSAEESRAAVEAGATEEGAPAAASGETAGEDMDEEDAMMQQALGT